jgi:PAS domain S-box-containing protein
MSQPASLGSSADDLRAHLAAIVNSSDDAIIGKDLDGIITSWNAGAARLYGYTAEEAVGRSVRMLVPEEQRGEIDDIMERVRRGERVAHYETIRRTKDGRHLHISLTVSPIKTSEGRITGASAVGRDITEQVEARAALAESEARYRTLFNSTSDGFCVLEMLLDEHGKAVDYRFLEMNPAFERHTGLRDAVGRRVLELVPNLERRWIETYGRVALTRERIRFVEYSKAMGRWFEVEAFPTGEAKKHRVALLFADVTQTKQADDALRESEERLRLAKSAARLGIHDYDPITGAIGWDERTREIWGVPKDEMVSYETWLHGLHPEDRDLAQAAVARALDAGGDGIYYAEYRVISRRDGGTRWVQVTGQSTFAEGKAVRLVGTVQDVTERKQAEDALREADRRKDEFLATLSHELRNPLAAIRTALAVLMDRLEDSERAREMAAIIDRQSWQLVRLIDDLLDVSRISRGKAKLARKRCDLVQIVREVMTDYHGMCQEKALEPIASFAERPLTIDADPVRIAQVINNLLNNACKFTPRGGKIHVAVERDGNEAVVRVSDTGVGISHEQLPRIFEMFEQLESPPNYAGGLGIGLSLARSLIEMHGGSIEAKSEGPGRGSEFTVRLHVLDESERRAARPLAEDEA